MARFAKTERLRQILGDERNPGALREIQAGQKQGHWIWWAFPPLTAYGADMFTPSEACLEGLSDAREYLGDSELRESLLATLRASLGAVSRHSQQGPWKVFDSAFGRRPQGVFVRGPVDAFKVRACATLFLAAAHAEGDCELHAACLDLLGRFTGDCSYSDQGSGSDPDLNGDCGEPVPLDGHDPKVLELIGVTFASVKDLRPAC